MLNYGALLLDGTDDSGAVSHHADYDFGTTTGLTVDVTIKGTSAGPILNKFSGGVGWKLEVLANGNAKATLNTITLSGGSILDGSWHQLRLVVDREGADAYLFVDATQVATEDITSLATMNNSANILIGYDGSAYLSATIQEIRISAVARCTADYSLPVFQYSDDPLTRLLLHFNEGQGATSYDMSEKRHNATLTGSPTWTDGGLAVSPATIAKDQIWLVLDTDTDLGNFVSRFRVTKFKFRPGDLKPGNLSAEHLPCLIVLLGDATDFGAETVAFHELHIPVIVEGYMAHEGIDDISHFWWLIIKAVFGRFNAGITGGRLEHKHLQNIELSGPNFATERGPGQLSNLLFSSFEMTFLMHMRVRLM